MTSITADDIIVAGPSHVIENEDETTPLLYNRKAGRSANMPEKNIGISQQTLVSSIGDQEIRAKKLPQYLAGLSATLGALAAGMVLAWTSSAGEGGSGLAKEYGFSISGDEFSWIGSLVNLGAAASCIPIGILCDIIGRKIAMLVLVVPFTIGWILVLFANSVTMFYFGRFILGFSGGAFCVAAPMYTAEIAESEIRGTLGSYFQLMLTAGILLSYVLGTIVNMFYLSLISAVVPIIFFVVFFFMPESPMYYLQKGRENDARQNLLKLRGPRYDIEPEIQAQLQNMAEAARSKVSFSSAIRSRAAVRGLIIGFGLMLFQQLSGVNAIIFYAGSIFEKANKSIRADISTIIVGVIQVVSVFLSTLIVDRLGRKILLLISDLSMCLMTFILAVYFYLQHAYPDTVVSIGWLPLLCICTFIFVFSIGFGPIPWLMMGEIFSPTIKGIAGSSACLFNWLMAFVVTKYYSQLEESAGAYTAFWLFSGICALGTAFVFTMVIETKGKSLEQIQMELSGSSRRNKSTI